MTKVVDKKNVGSAIGELFKNQQQVQQGNTGGGGSSGANPNFETIGVGGIILRPEVTAPGAASGLTGLRLTPGAHLSDIWVDVEWSGPTDESAVQYHLDYAEKDAASLAYTLENVLVTSGTSMRVRPLAPNTVYGFRVSSLNRIGRFSETFPAGGGYQDITTSGDTTIPGSVTGLQASAGYKSITATWNEAVEADVKNGQGVYDLQIDTASSFNSANLKSVRVGGTIASFSDLQLSTTYYLRVAAIDASGNQGVYSNIVSANTAGQIIAQPSDGIPPTNSPAPTKVLGGNGFIYLEWNATTNTDPVTYDIHISASSGFLPSSSNKTFSTPGTFGFIKSLPNGAALQYGVTYYIKIVARDGDGSAPAGAQATGTPAKISGTDINDGSISTVLILDAAISTAKIADASIIEAKIVNAAITSAKIANAAIESAHIQNAAIVNAKIANAAIDDAKIANLSASKILFGTMSGDRITANSLDASTIKTSSLNSATITLTGGALRVLRTNTSAVGMLMNSQGISFYNSVGVRKIFLDAQTGNGAFSGNIDSSTITTSTVSSTTVNGGTINGAIYRTATGLPRIEISPSNSFWGDQHSILFESYSGQPKVGYIRTIPYIAGEIGPGLLIDSGSRFSGIGVALARLTLHGFSGDATLFANNSVSFSTNGTIESKCDKFTIKYPDAFTDTAMHSSFSMVAGSTFAVSEVRFRREDETGYINLRASNFLTSSSRDYKKDIVVFEKSALSEIKKAQAKTFRFVQNENEELGLVAEDLPEFVKYGDGWSLPAAIAMLWKAVQELDAKVDANGK